MQIILKLHFQILKLSILNVIVSNYANTYITNLGNFYIFVKYITHITQVKYPKAFH